MENQFNLIKSWRAQSSRGNSGLSMVFKVISVSDTSITLQYRSENNEENFPGELIYKITYTLTEEKRIEK